MLATSYRADLFEPVLGDGSAWGIRLSYVQEQEPLGTGGAIRNVAAALTDDPDAAIVDPQRRHPLRARPRRPARRLRDPARRASGRRLPAPGRGRGRPGVRLRADRRRRAGHRLRGEVRPPGDAARSTRAATSSGAGSSTPSRPTGRLGRARDLPRPGARRRPRRGLPGQRLLARRRDARGAGRRIGRPGARVAPSPGRRASGALVERVAWSTPRTPWSTRAARRARSWPAVHGATRGAVVSGSVVMAGAVVGEGAVLALASDRARIGAGVGCARSPSATVPSSTRQCPTAPGSTARGRLRRAGCRATRRRRARPGNAPSARAARARGTATGHPQLTGEHREDRERREAAAGGDEHQRSGERRAARGCGSARSPAGPRPWACSTLRRTQPQCSGAGAEVVPDQLADHLAAGRDEAEEPHVVDAGHRAAHHRGTASMLTSGKSAEASRARARPAGPASVQASARPAHMAWGSGESV